MKIKFNKLLSIILLIILNFSCVEEIELTTQTEFESILVVEATITNEVKTQKILLSRTTLLEEEFNPVFESGATVTVKDNNNNVYNFQESDSGVYLSSSPFAAVLNIEYHLEISTIDGRKYNSTNMQLTQPTLIDNLYVERGFNEDGDEGVSIFVDSFDPTGNSKFYRYTYEETYKIIAPFYSPLDLVPDALVGCPNFELRPKEEQEQICYNTVKSNEIIIENTNLFEEDRIDKFKVRFINRNNFIMSHRYSILVTQHIQSIEAHNFYEALKQFSESESLFSQTQLGFISGNVFSATNNQEKVLGFFEVSSVDLKRIYFNYSDLFPGEILPPYYISCNLFSPVKCSSFGENSPLSNALTQGNKYFQFNGNPEMGEGSYSLVAPACGDCTVLGKNVVPDFWVE